MRKSASSTWLRYGRTALESKARAALIALADLIWPPQSPLSGRPVSAPGLLDAADFARIRFLDAPWCARCGVPFDFPVFDGMECAPCIANPPVVSRARAAFVYDEASRALALGLKHGGRTDGLAGFGRWMARAGREFLPEADLLIPVPLHPSRLLKRRFNQSLLLARAVSAVSGAPVEPHALARVKATPIQGGLGAEARARNVAGAFRVRERGKARIAGRTVVLIDDVHTTGATLDACARALRRAGAADVNALTLARVVKPVDPLK